MPHFLLLLTCSLWFFAQSCSFQSSLDYVTADVQAALALGSADTQCINEFDCRIINQDCCSAEEGISAINRNAARRLQKDIDATCQKKHEEASKQGQALCKDIKPHPRAKYPKVACENNVCTIKAKVDAGPAACTSDAQCEVFDPDCCNTGTGLIAIHSDARGSKRGEKGKECRAKLEANRDLCRGVRPLRTQSLTKAVCESGQCALKQISFEK